MVPTVMRECPPLVALHRSRHAVSQVPLTAGRPRGAGAILTTVRIRRSIHLPSAINTIY